MIHFFFLSFYSTLLCLHLPVEPWFFHIVFYLALPPNPPSQALPYPGSPRARFDRGIPPCNLTTSLSSSLLGGCRRQKEKDEFDLSDSPHLADMLPDIGQTSSEQADLYKDVQVFGPESLQRGIRALNEEFKNNFAEHVQKEPARVAPRL